METSPMYEMEIVKTLQFAHIRLPHNGIPQSAIHIVFSGMRNSSIHNVEPFFPFASIHSCTLVSHRKHNQYKYVRACTSGYVNTKLENAWQQHVGIQFQNIVLL